MIEADRSDLFNTAVVVSKGQLIGRYRKSNILAGERLFRRGSDVPTFETDGLRFGINICSDTVAREPAAMAVKQGARAILCPSNNLLQRTTAETWKGHHNEMRRERARKHGVWLVSADVTGERDDCIAFGPTAVIDPSGRVVTQVPTMEVGLVCADISLPG
jgi:predicted amidohydrolase